MDLKWIIAVALATLIGVVLFFSSRPTLEPQPQLIIAQGGSGQVALVDPASGKMSSIAVGPAIHGVDTLPDSTKAFTASFGSDEVSVIDLKQKREIAKVNVGGKSHHISVSPDGRWAYVAVGSNNTVAIIDARSDTLVATISVGEGPTYTVFAPDGQNAYVTSMKAGLVSVINASQQQIVKEIAVGAQPDHLAVTPDGRYLYVVNQGSNDVSVIDTESNMVIATIPVGKGPHGVAVGNRQGRPIVFVGNRAETTLSLIDPAANSVIGTVKLGSSPEHLTTSADGRYLYIGSIPNRSLFIFDVGRGQVVKRIDVGGEIHQISIVGSPEIVTAAGGTYRNVMSEQLQAMLREKDFLLVNVHIPYEGELPQTDAFVPYNEIEKNLNRLPQDKTAKIVLYCMSGRMSAIAAETLVKLGYPNIWNLKEGMREWQEQGFPLLNKPQG